MVTASSGSSMTGGVNGLDEPSRIVTLSRGSSGETPGARSSTRMGGPCPRRVGELCLGTGTARGASGRGGGDEGAGGGVVLRLLEREAHGHVGSDLELRNDRGTPARRALRVRPEQARVDLRRR
jgi:hypothetical protein